MQVEGVYPQFSLPLFSAARRACSLNERAPRGVREGENQSFARKPPAKPEAEEKSSGEGSMRVMGLVLVGERER